MSSYEELRRAIDSAHASVGLVIDRDFGKDVHRGAPAHALLIVNASDTTTSSQAMSIASGIANGLSIRVLAGAGGLEVVVAAGRPARAALVQPGPEDGDVHHPGPDRHHPDLHAHPVHRDRRSSASASAARSSSSRSRPSRASRSSSARSCRSPLIGYVQLTMTILLMRYLFGIVIQGSVFELYVVGLLFIAAVLGLGMLISTRRQDADAGDADVDLRPAAVRVPLGLRLPDRRHAADLPAPVAASSRPATSSRSLRGIILRGAGLVELWQPVAWLTLYTLLIIALAVARFKKTTA